MSASKASIWEGIAFSCVLMFFCSLLIVTFNVDVSPQEDFRILLKKMLIWVVFCLLGGLTISTRKGTRFLQLVGLAAFPGGVLLASLLFIYLITGLLHPVRSIAAGTSAGDTRPVVYENRGGYYVIEYSPNASIAPIPAYVPIATNDPILREARIISMTALNRAAVAKKTAIMISLALFVVIAAATPFAIAISHYAKGPMLALVGFLTANRSQEAVRRMEKTITRLVGLLGAVGGLVATIWTLAQK